MSTATPRPIFAALGQFDGPASLLEAARKARQAGYVRIDTYSPFPIHGSDDAIGLKRSKLPLLVFGGGLTGGTLGWWVQSYLSSKVYPIIVGGKPLDSWEAWVPITFELVILFSALTAVFGMFLLNGLPKFYHPNFRDEAFARVTDDGFALSIDATDPRFEPNAVLAFLTSAGATGVSLVEDPSDDEEESRP